MPGQPLTANPIWSKLEGDISPAVYRRIDLRKLVAEGGGEEGALWDALDKLEDSSCHEIEVHRLVERLPPSKWPTLFAGLYRVCAHGATVRVYGTHHASEAALADFRVYRGLSRSFFAHLSKIGRLHLPAVGVEDPADFDCDFETERMVTVCEPGFESDAYEVREFKSVHYRNVIRDLDVYLRCYKPARSDRP